VDSDVRLLTGSDLANEVRAGVARRAAALRARGIHARVALVGGTRRGLSRAKQAEGEKAGVRVRALGFGAGRRNSRCSRRSRNATIRTCGVLLQMPLPRADAQAQLRDPA
jgi:hypothetical protein